MNNVGLDPIKHVFKWLAIHKMRNALDPWRFSSIDCQEPRLHTSRVQLGDKSLYATRRTASRTLERSYHMQNFHLSQLFQILRTDMSQVDIRTQLVIK